MNILMSLYKSPHGKSYLFTGDTIFQWNPQWGTLVIERGGGSATALADSLLRLRNLNPALVMSSGFVGDISEVKVTGNEWANAIDDTLARMLNHP